MALTTAGVNFIAEAVVGSGTPFNSANAYIGVGDGTEAFMASQTDLQGASRVRMPMEGGYPMLTAPKVVFKATYKQEDANFAWNEWGIFNAASGGVMLNRVVEYNGTKLNTQTWVMEVSITFTTT